MIGIYVHLPFCPYICPYCDFAKWPHKASAGRRYMEALLQEIDAEPPGTGEYTVFLGGGTPNTYAPAVIADLLRRIEGKFSTPSRPEVTIEVNPELVTGAALEAYSAAGVTRLSIGVQSFVEGELRTLGRCHDTGMVRTAIRAAREAGIGSVSLDLMFAVPGQTAATWRHSLETAVALAPDHISTYGLTVEDGTPYASWRDREPAAFADQDLEGDLYEIAIDTLERAGFEHYEISNFALSGHRCAHNANYWANGEYIGFGVGAASHRNGVRSTHTRDLETYIAAASQGRKIPGLSERLEGARRAGEAVMLALRTSQGLSFAAFKERYGLNFLEYYAAIVEPYRAAGLLDVDAAGARLTRRGRFVANDICATFITLP